MPLRAPYEASARDQRIRENKRRIARRGQKKKPKPKPPQKHRTFENSLQGDPATILTTVRRNNDEIEKYINKVTKLETENAELRAELLELQKKREELTRVISELEAKTEELDHKSNEEKESQSLINLKALIVSLKQEKVEWLEKNAKDIKEKTALVLNLLSQIQDYRARIQILEARNKELFKANQTTNQSLKISTEEIKNVQKQLKALQANNGSLNSDKENELKKYIEELKKKIQECEEKLKASLDNTSRDPRNETSDLLKETEGIDDVGGGPATTVTRPEVSEDGEARELYASWKKIELEAREKMRELETKLEAGDIFVTTAIQDPAYGLDKRYNTVPFKETWSKYFRDKQELTRLSTRYSKLFQDFAYNPAYLRFIFLTSEDALREFTRADRPLTERLPFSDEDVFGPRQLLDKLPSGKSAAVFHKEFYNKPKLFTKRVRSTGGVTITTLLSLDELKTMVYDFFDPTLATPDRPDKDGRRIPRPRGKMFLTDDIEKLVGGYKLKQAQTGQDYVQKMDVLIDNPIDSEYEQPNYGVFTRDYEQWLRKQKQYDKEERDKQAERDAEASRLARQNRRPNPFGGGGLPRGGLGGLGKVTLRSKDEQKPLSKPAKKPTDPALEQLLERGRQLRGDDDDEDISYTPPVSKFVPRLSTYFIRKKYSK